MIQMVIFILYMSTLCHLFGDKKRVYRSLLGSFYGICPPLLYTQVIELTQKVRNSQQRLTLQSSPPASK